MFQLADCTLQMQNVKMKIWRQVLRLSDVEHVPNRECVLEHQVYVTYTQKRDITN